MRPARAALLLLGAGLGFGLGLGAVPAAAHRGHATLSVVEIDAKSGAVTVTHRMSAHDVEPVLATIAPEAQPSVDDPEAMAALVTYVGRAFRVEGAALSPAGRRLAGDTVELRFAGRIARQRPQVVISGALFGETHPDHATQVNVRRAGVTRTLNFHPGDPPQPVVLPLR